GRHRSRRRRRCAPAPPPHGHHRRHRRSGSHLAAAGAGPRPLPRPLGERRAVRPYFDGQAALVGRLLGEGESLAHALLLAGSPGAGKRRTAEALAQGLLCETPRTGREGGLACGACSGCRWFEAGNHPDFRLVSLLEKDGKLAWEISIDQVRQLEDFAGLSAFRDGARVVLVDPAETLSVPAANALLKLLEEPGGRTWFLLVTHRPDSLPATVRSRCRRVAVPAPDGAE